MEMQGAGNNYLRTKPIITSINIEIINTIAVMVKKEYIPAMGSHIGSNSLQSAFRYMKIATLYKISDMTETKNITTPETNNINTDIAVRFTVSLYAITANSTPADTPKIAGNTVR